MSHKLQSDFFFLTKDLFRQLQYDKSKDTWNSIQVDVNSSMWQKQLLVDNEVTEATAWLGKGVESPSEVDFKFGFGFCMAGSRNNKFFDNNKGFYATFHDNGRLKLCCGYFYGMESAIWIYYDIYGNKTMQGMYFQQEELLGKWIQV